MWLSESCISAAGWTRQNTGALCDAKEIICCSGLPHAILVFLGISPMDFLADFSRSSVWCDCRVLWYVGLWAKNIQYFWNVFIAVQNRPFFHSLTRFCHFSNMLILPLLWHPYSLVLFWCVLCIKLMYSSVWVCITVCDLYKACLVCTVTKITLTFVVGSWLGYAVFSQSIARSLCLASLHSQARPLLQPGKGRHKLCSTTAGDCRWGMWGLWSCWVEISRSLSYTRSWAARVQMRAWSANVVKVHMEKMVLKTGIKLPWSRGETYWTMTRVSQV